MVWGPGPGCGERSEEIREVGQNAGLAVGSGFEILSHGNVRSRNESHGDREEIRGGWLHTVR